MKNIINYALKHGEIDKDMLVAAVNAMDEDMAIRFTEAVLGIAVQEKIPEVSKVYDRDNCRLLGYNYLKDAVEYEYEDEGEEEYEDEGEEEDEEAYDETETEYEDEDIE